MESTLKSSTITLSACCVAISGGFFLHKLYTSQQQQKPQDIQEKCTKLENLPTEIISEIISYLSVEDLVRCKSVWKQLHVNTKDSEFVRRFMMRKTPYYFCNVDDIYWEEKNSIVRETLATCGGLKMKRKSIRHCSDSWRYFYYIKNPATRKVLVLPNPPSNRDDNRYAFSFVSSTSVFKVVVIYKQKDKRKCALLTLGTYENKWRILDVPGGICFYLFAIQTGTVVHCVRGYNNDSLSTYEISSLDLETECFSVTSIEKSFITREGILAFGMNWNGVFAFVYIERDELTVLVLEDYKTQKWANNRFTIHLSFLNEESYVKMTIYPQSADNGMIWFACDDALRIRYDPTTGKIVQKICDPSEFGHLVYGRVFSLTPSHIILKGMHTKGEKSIYSLMSSSLSTGITKLSSYLRRQFNNSGAGCSSKAERVST